MAIIGGGMAGLVCAQNLEARGVQSTVFDTVRLFWFLCKISELEFGR